MPDGASGSTSIGRGMVGIFLKVGGGFGWGRKICGGSWTLRMRMPALGGCSSSEQPMSSFAIPISFYMTRNTTFIFLFLLYLMSGFSYAVLLKRKFPDNVPVHAMTRGWGGLWDRKRSDNPTDMGIAGVQICSDPDRPRAKPRKILFGQSNRPPHLFSGVLSLTTTTSAGEGHVVRSGPQ